MVSCLLLSAGLSARFGSPKALAKINSSTVIEHLQKNLISSGVDKIIVVLGAEAHKIKSHILKHKKVTFVYNKDYKLGQTSSFKTGLRAIGPETSGIMLLLVDFPLVRQATLNQLVDYFGIRKPSVLIPTYHSRKGHPPLFSYDLKDKFLALDDSQGVNEFEHRHEAETVLLPVDDPGVLKGFNTLEEFEEIKKGFKVQF